MLGRITWFVEPTELLSEAKAVAVASVVCRPRTNKADCETPDTSAIGKKHDEKTVFPIIALVVPLLPPIALLETALAIFCLPPKERAFDVLADTEQELPPAIEAVEFVPIELFEPPTIADQVAPVFTVLF